MLLGFDIGSSSVKAALVNEINGQCLDATFYPKTEQFISSPEPGFAEQAPEMWYDNLKLAARELFSRHPEAAAAVKAIGISYQMHGLVCLDAAGKPLREAIIWCDSRAVRYGEQAADKLGHEWCLEHLLNLPGNFTAAKLAWVKDHQPEIYDRTTTAFLPGDYIAYRLTGQRTTTISGLSEGMMWDHKEQRIAHELFEAMGLDENKLATCVPTFAVQGYVSPEAAAEIGVPAGIPVSYRAGDQPNNALSLGVLNPGEVAATGGTSGVVYAVSADPVFDMKSRVNPFVHVNGNVGVLLCINAVGILNAWLRRNIASDLSYEQINELAATAPAGSDGLTIIPFGNGAERVLENKESACAILGLQLNRHTRAHILRAAHEGIAFAFAYGMEIMNRMGISTTTIRAGYGNLFLSPIFRETLAAITGARILLLDTDGAQGAARGAGIGIGLYAHPEDAFASLACRLTIEPQPNAALQAAYERWKASLAQSVSPSGAFQ